MNKKFSITIWENCDPTIAGAIRQFEERWHPYSISSRRYPIGRLIQEIVDYPVATYMKTLPNNYWNHVPGVGAGIGFSEIIRLIGLDAMVRMQRELLRQFIKTAGKQTTRDSCFIDTLESLIELVWSSACKKSKSSIPTAGVTLNSRRKNGFCELCGNQTEFSAFMTKVGNKAINNMELDNHKKLELSHQYCSEHRPKLTSGQWNSRYRQAKRSQKQFNTELKRITQQCAKRSHPQSTSGDELIDTYVHQLMLAKLLQPSDQAELRNLARRMVDSKLSDNKKRMLVLQLQGFTQTEIGKRVLNTKKQPMTRQAVSKALASIRDEFILAAKI